MENVKYLAPRNEKNQIWVGHRTANIDLEIPPLV